MRFVEKNIVTFNCLLLILKSVTSQRQLDVSFELQQLHLPLDGIAFANTAAVTNSNLTAYFPGGAITKYDAPSRQGSTRALAFQKDHYGYLEGAYPWLYDLEKTPTGITILLYFKVSVTPRGPAYLLAVGNREIDPSNAAGWDIHVNSATRKLEVRFGYRTYDFRCECGNINVNRWYSVHASCRNYFGFLQYSVAVNGIPCGQEQEDKCRVVEKTPNYDPVGIDRMYIGTLTPTTENNAEITLDEIRIYNTWIDFDSPDLPPDTSTSDPIEADTDLSVISPPVTEASYIVDSFFDGKDCCSDASRNSTCKSSCDSPAQSKLLQQIKKEFAIKDTCTTKDFCSLNPCSDSCNQSSLGYSCGCREGYFLDKDSSTCVNHCDGVFCQINTRCIPNDNKTAKLPFKCICDAAHTGDFCEIEKNLCLPNPCLHGACVSGGPNGFTCICDAEYTGDLCEEEVLDCSRNPCRHGGTCVAEDSERGFKCVCKDGYNGDVCEKAADACTFVQCSNGGRCQILNGAPMCVCATEFNDTNCEISNTPCEPNPCTHGGTCEQDGRHFKCLCPEGFKQYGRCEEDINECLDQNATCIGNATCENTIGSYICHCAAGYALPDCLKPINLCSSSPCLNGATCNPVPLSYTCTCAPGYVGQHCDIKGADRCTVTASEAHIVAGRYVTYVLQCASLGDKARFYFNMGDRFYFDATQPVYTPAASDAIRARTRIEVTLQMPSERYLYYYKHWFNSAGEYALTVQVYNGEFPTAKYITMVRVDPYPDICFPTVSIINGGWNISSGPPFHRSQYFVIQSSVTKPFFNTKCAQYIFVYEWTLYKLTVDHPIPELAEDWTGPRKSNEVIFDDYIKDIRKNDKYIAFPANTFMYGSYMDMLKVTATTNETVKSFTEAAQTLTELTPFVTTIITDIQDLMNNLTSAIADVKKEAELPEPFEELVIASQMLNDSVESMKQSIANLTAIQPLLPNATSALIEASNAKVESIRPNAIVSTKVPPPVDPLSTTPIVPPKSVPVIATDALKLVERATGVLNSTMQAVANLSMAVATAMMSMGNATDNVKKAELTIAQKMHRFDEHLMNMTDKLDVVRTGKMAIDSDLINVDRGWFKITPTPIKLEIKGGTKRIVSTTDSIILDATNPQFSWDPDDRTPAESQVLTYYWFGTPPGGAFPERYFPQAPASVEILLTNGCLYPNCPGYIPNSKGQKTYTIPGPLKEGVYFFQVAVEVQRNLDGLTPPVLTPYIGTSMQMVTVVADGFPSVEINCLKSNCAARIDAGERFALEGTCDHCDGATFLWEVLSTSDEDFDKDIIWSNDSTNHPRTEFNKTWPIFAALPNVFPLDQSEALYRFKFTVTMPDNKTTTAEYSARINEPPSGGKCVVDPVEGNELETLFDVECRDFIDHDHDLPLMYRFHYHNGEEKVVAPNDTIEMEGTLLYYNIDPYLPATVLSRGDPERNYSAEIYVGVYDALGSVQVTKLDIRVLPKTETAEGLSDSLRDFMSPGGLLARNLDAKNDQGTAQAALVISRQLNNPLLENQTENSLDPDKKKEMRNTLVDALGTVPVNSLGAVQQVAASLSQVVGDPHEIRDDTQVSSADILVNLADRLAVDMRVDAGPQEMEETAGFMIRALTNLFDAIDHRQRPERPAFSLADGGPEPPPPPPDAEAKKAGTNCVKSLNLVMKSYGATKIVGEEPTEFVSPEMLVGVQQQKAADVKTRIATGKMKDYLEIPDDMGDSLGGKAVQVQTMLSENNLYAWAASSSDVTTPNVELSFADPKTQDSTPLKDLKKPIHVAFPLKHEAEENGISRGGNISFEQWTLSMPAMYYSSMNMTMQKISEVPRNKSVVVQLTLRTSHNIKLSVLATSDQPPYLEDSKRDDQIGQTVEGFEDHGQHEPKEFYFVYPAEKRKADTSVVYVAVVAGELTEYKDSNIRKTVDNPPVNSIKNITYNFTAFAVACMYWEGAIEEWSTAGCSVSNRTTSKMIHCDCDHTSVFSAGMFVPPNKLEPIDPAKLALMFFQNPLILITCAIIWVIYLVTLIYARRLDRKEEEKRGVHVLLDNDPNDTYFYVVTVSTGARPKAGTSAKVGIILRGAHDQTEPHIMNDVLDMKFFETGGEDSFLLATSDYLGELQTIALWHNGEGSRPGWFVDEVLVRDVQTNEVFFFLPNRWLAADKEDYQLSAEIPVSSHDDLTSTYHRFTTFTTSGIRDGHLWISIFFRPPRSPFTRAQRTTCVLSLLLTTMLANIMFYGIPKDDPNQQRSFKGFEFNWAQVMLGIQSALVVLPVNLGVIYLFQNAKARHARGLEDVAEGDIPKQQEPPKQQLSITYLQPAVLKLFQFNRPIRKLFVRPLRLERLDDSPLIEHTKHNLPFWTKPVAWLVGLGTAIVSTIFVCWFGLSYGRTKSQEWLASFFAALAIDVLVSQPLKVLLISFLVAAILRKPPAREHEGTVVSAFSEFGSGVKDIRNRLGYSPPSSEWVAAVRKMAFLTDRMQTWFMDIGWFVLFMFSVYVFTYGNTPLGGSGVRTSLDSMFIGSDVKDANEKPNGPLSKVETVEMMWLYLQNNFLDKYSPEATARPALLDKSVHFMADEANLCLGPARLRQVRIPRENCSIDWRIVNFNMSCLPEYSTSLHDTRSFLPSWILPNITTPTDTNNSTNTTESSTTPPDFEDTADFVSDRNLNVQLRLDDIHNPWVYKNSTELGIGHFMANLNTYKGGGFVAVIPQERDGAKERLDELKNSVWIDDLTRAIFLQMNTYNPSTNVFSIMFLVFEFHQSGLIIPFHRIDTIRLMYTDPMIPLDLATIVFGICAVIFLCFLTVSLVKDISDTLFQRSWKYFREPWNWLEVFIVSLGWGTVACYMHSQWNKMAAVKLILKAPQDHFVSFYFAVLTELAFLDMAALFLFVCSVKLLKIFRINRKVNSLFYVMNDARVPLIGYGMSLLLAMIPFIIAGHIIFGRSLERHATFGASIVTLVRVMVSDLDGLYDEYSGVERILGPIYFLTAIFTTIFLYTNAFVSLIMIVYEKTLEERKEKIDRDAELADFVMERLKRLLGIRVEHPVIDFTKFPAAVALREMTAHLKNLDAKPKAVQPAEWSHFLEIAELRRLIQNVAQDIRGSGIADAEAGPKPQLNFRTDFASHTNDWFFVHGVPPTEIDGPRTFPVDKVTRANGMMEGLDGLEEKDVVGMSGYNWDQLTIHQNLLAETRLAVDLAMNPEPPPPLSPPKRKKIKNDVRSSKSTSILPKQKTRK